MIIQEFVEATFRILSTKDFPSTEDILAVESYKDDEAMLSLHDAKFWSIDWKVKELFHENLVEADWTELDEIYQKHLGSSSNVFDRFLSNDPKYTANFKEYFDEVRALLKDYGSLDHAVARWEYLYKRQTELKGVLYPIATTSFINDLLFIFKPVEAIITEVSCMFHDTGTAVAISNLKSDCSHCTSENVSLC